MRTTACLSYQKWGLFTVANRLSFFPSNILPEKIKTLVLKNIKHPNIRIRCEAIRCLLHIDAYAAQTALYRELVKYDIHSSIQDVIDEGMEIIQDSQAK